MRLHALQYLRAIAALAVVYGHASIQVPAYEQYLLEFGSFGVDIFFVISGFIMMFITKPTDTPGAFMVNRIRRVVPLYWFFTLLMGTIFLLMPSVFNNADLTVTTFFQSLLFVPHFSAAHPGEIWPIVAPGWSLIYEMYFYGLFALSLFVAMRMRLLFITVVISSVYICAKLMNTGGAYNAFFTDEIVFEFIFGMVLAQLWRNGLRLSSSAGALLFVAGFALLLIHSQFNGFANPDFGIPGILTNGIPAIMVVTGALYMVVPVNKLFMLLGDASYALYLSHIFVLGALRLLLPPLLGDGPLGAYLFAFISLAVCLLASVVVHNLVDNWLLRHERLGSVKPMKSREA